MSTTTRDLPRPRQGVSIQNTDRPRAALYLRLSEENEYDKTATGDSASIGRQEADLRALCDREGWDVGPVYVDDGLTGRKERDKARQAVDDLASGRVAVLATWKWDRFGRRGNRDLADVLVALEQNPAGLFVAYMDGLRSDMGDVWEPMAGMIAWAAKREAENTSLRVTRAIVDNRRAGRWTGGPAPFGYRSAPNPNGPGSVLVLEPTESRALTEAARAVMEGASLYSITQRLNASDVPPRRAKAWSVQAVRQALTGTSIVGRLKVNGEVIRNADGTPREVFPPAIPVDLWHAVRAVIAARSAEYPNAGTRPRGRRSRLLSGIASCAGCGSPLYLRTNSDGNVSYRCGTVSTGRPCEVSASTSADLLEAYVEAEVLPVLRPLRLVAPVAHETDTSALADVLEAIAETQAAFVPGADFAALTARMEALGSRKAELEAIARDTPPTSYLVETGETFGDLWDRADVHTRREHLARALDRVVVRRAGRRGRPVPLSPERVTVLWRADEMGAPDYLMGQVD